VTYRATGSTARSACSLTCKCSFLPDKGWAPEFFTKIGLGCIANAGFKAIGTDPVLTAGEPVGSGLHQRAAEELGLLPGTPVGSAVIDAYAGWIGTVAARAEDATQPPTLDQSRVRLAAIAGTSTCYLIQNPKGLFIPGVWGPYKNAVFADWWMSEGGQSSTGQLIDFVLQTHPAHAELKAKAAEQKVHETAVLQDVLRHLCQEEGLSKNEWTKLTRHMHMYPDLHGNRSPIADPRMRGSIVGLTLDAGLGDLARRYNVALEAIALQTKHILDEMRGAGHTVDYICMSGGQTKNARLLKLLADLTGAAVLVPSDGNGGDAVVRGAAALARCAAERKGLWDIMVEMTPVARVVRSDASPPEHRTLEAKYKIFRETVDTQRRWRKEMDAAAANQ